MDFTLIVEYFPRLLEAALVTIQVSLAALALATIMGFIAALTRTSHRTWLYLPAVAYTEALRSVPTLVLLFLLYYALPALLRLNIPSFPAAVLALGLAGSAYMAEIIRGGIEAIGHGQWEAAHSLGLRYPAILRFVIMPQALRLSIPPAISLYVALIKDSSLILLVGVVELTTQGMQIRALTHGRSSFAVFITLGIMYFVICTAVALAGNRLERRLLI